jgi:hypothetical protein
MEYCFQIEAATALGGFEQWVKYFHSLLAAHAVVVVIDSLDQLSNDDEARSGMTFLKGLKPHADTRVIVSCLPDETDALTGKRYFYGCDTRLREAGVCSHNGEDAYLRNQGEGVTMIALRGARQCHSRNHCWKDRAEAGACGSNAARRQGGGQGVYFRIARLILGRPLERAKARLGIR